MAEVTITLNGRAYEIACDAGQEGRIVDLAAYIDQRLSQIARSGGAYNDAHLMVLTSLVLAHVVQRLHGLNHVRAAHITTRCSWCSPVRSWPTSCSKRKTAHPAQLKKRPPLFILSKIKRKNRHLWDCSTS